MEINMFFVFGISNGEKKLDYIQTLLCSRCEQYGKLELYMTYYYFSLFFIPIFKWNRKFIVKSSCCGSIFTLNHDLGRRIYKGETVIITDNDLTLVHGEGNTNKSCTNCGKIVSSEYTYCPHCGHYVKH
jgi:hypothetical protein